VSRAWQVGRWVAVVVAILLLNVSLSFYNIWPTPRIRWQGHVSVELAVVVLGLAAWRRSAMRSASTSEASRLPTAFPHAWGLRWLAAAWVALVVGRYLDVMAPALYGRPINLYWDSRHLSAVFAMMTDSIPTLLVAGGLAAIVVGLGVAYLLARVAWGAVASALANPPGRRVLVATAIAAVVLWGVEQRRVPVIGTEPEPTLFAPTVSQAYFRHARLLASQLTSRTAAVVTSRQATESDLDQVRGADVYLIFVESYGAVAYDRPAVSRIVSPFRQAFEVAVRDSGKQVVSAFVESPTFAGSSWLAHVTLMSGVETRDEDTNVVLMSQQRDTLVTTFARQGYRTVAMMPGLSHSWPEGAFYRFDRIYDERQMDYKGPQFGWWSIPDQFALAQFDRLEQSTGGPSAAPRFLFFPTTSTHAPFGPTAPYQPDWSRLASTTPYDQPDVDAALAREPDWDDLTPSYANAVSYAYSSIAGYLRQHADRDFVMVMLGDHQPAAAVAGEGASWDVPVHIIASRPAIMERLRAKGFHDGMTPPRRAIGRMHELLPTLLGAFGNRPPQADATISRIGQPGHSVATGKARVAGE